LGQAAVPHLFPLPEPAYAQSGINTAIFRRNALLTIGSHQLVSYFAKDGKAVLLLRSLPSDRIERTLRFDNPMPAQMLGDGHQGINLGYSADGFVHIIWGCHSTPNPPYLKLRWPDLTIVRGAPPPWAGITTRLSYPQFYGPPERLLLSFRRDISPGTASEQYDHCLLQYDARIGKWQPLEAPLLRYPSNQLAYLNTLGDMGDTLAGAYTIRREDLMDRRDPAMRVMNQSFHVIVSRDHGQTWSNLAGQLLPVPIAALDETSLALRISPDQKLINQGGGWLAKDDKYHFGYFRSDTHGIPQIYLTTVDLSTGQHSTAALTSRHQSFDLLGRGTQIWPISRPAVFEVGQTLAVAYREDNHLICQFRNPIAGTWRKAELYAGELGNYEPILDYIRLRDGVMTFYMQPSWQGQDDTPDHSASSASAFLLQVSERELLVWPDSRAK
jgi:hypothetical protein